jgi:hypothetical protein
MVPWGPKHGIFLIYVSKLPNSIGLFSLQNDAYFFHPLLPYLHIFEPRLLEVHSDWMTDMAVHHEAVVARI